VFFLDTDRRSECRRIARKHGALIPAYYRSVWFGHVAAHGLRATHRGGLFSMDPTSPCRWRGEGPLYSSRAGGDVVTEKRFWAAVAMFTGRRSRRSLRTACSCIDMSSRAPKAPADSPRTTLIADVSRSPAAILLAVYVQPLRGYVQLDASSPPSGISTSRLAETAWS